MFLALALVAACADGEVPVASPAPAPGLAPTGGGGAGGGGAGGGVLGYVTDMMHYLTEVASGFAAAANDTDSQQELLPHPLLLAAEVPRRPVTFKYTVDELYHAHFDRKVSNDVDIDPCKAGKSRSTPNLRPPELPRKSFSFIPKLTSHQLFKWEGGGKEGRGGQGSGVEGSGGEGRGGLSPPLQRWLLVRCGAVWCGEDVSFVIAVRRLLCGFLLAVN